MFENQSGDLSDVLKQLKRADEALTEFIAPLWLGVTRAAVWMEGRARLFRLQDVPTETQYYLLGVKDDTAFVIRQAEPDEARRYREFLVKANVILLEGDLAYPSSLAERLQGITAPRPIHFATGKPLTQVQARFDGVNLFCDMRGTAESVPSLLGDIFAASSIFSPGELLGIPGTEAGDEEAREAQTALQENPDLATEYRLRAVLESAGAVLESWSREDGALRAQWRRGDEECTVTLQYEASPITSGICLPGARGFDPAQLTRLLLDHALDAWR